MDPSAVATLKAAARSEWDLDADEILLNQLNAISEHFMSRMTDTKAEVDKFCDEVNVSAVTLQSTFNEFVLLSQTQFIENRCGLQVEDDEEDEEKSEEEVEDRDAKVARLYATALQLSNSALGSLSIPLYDSDLEDEEDEEVDEEGDEEDEEGEEKEKGGKALLATIGTEDFLNDPYCGLPVVGEDESVAESSYTSSDSEAEPVALAGKSSQIHQEQTQTSSAGVPSIASNAPPIAASNAPPIPAASNAPPIAAPAKSAPRVAPPTFAESSDDDDAQPIQKPNLAEVRSRVERIYQKYNPDKLDEVPDIIQKFKGRETQLIAALVQKYGPEPTGPTTKVKPPSALESSSDSDAAPSKPRAAGKKAPPKAAFGGDSDSDDAPRAKVSKPIPQKAFDSSSGSDSEEAKPRGKVGAQTAAPTRAFVSDDSESGDAVASRPAAAPKKSSAKKPTTKKALSSDSDSDDAPRAAPKKAPPKPVAKRAIGSDDDSESDDAPRAAPKKAPPVFGAPKVTPSAPAGGDSDEGEPPKRAPPPVPKRPQPAPDTDSAESDAAPPPKRGPKLPPRPKAKTGRALDSSDDETQFQSRGLSKPPPKAKIVKRSIYSSESD